MRLVCEPARTKRPDQGPTSLLQPPLITVELDKVFMAGTLCEKLNWVLLRMLRSAKLAALSHCGAG